MATALTLIDKILFDLDQTLATIQIKKKFVNFRIEKFQSKYFKEASDILKDGFLKRTEPMNMGAPEALMHVLLNMMLSDEASILDTTVVAVENNSNKVIGVVVSNDMSIEIPPEAMKQFKQIDGCESESFSVSRAFTLLNELTNDFKSSMKAKNEWKKGIVLELTLSAVHRDYQRQGVVTALKKYMVNKARENGWKYIVSEASNNFSQGQNGKIGFKIEKEISYNDWEYPNGSKKFPYKWVEGKTGHKKCCLMINYLDETDIV